MNAEFANKKILVVDDSSFMRQYIIGFLNEIGLNEIIEAKDGEEALKKYQAENPDVVLMDLIMPNLSGDKVLGELVSLGARVIVVSAIGQKQIVERVFEMGAKGYFVKPFFTAKEIENKILEALK